MWWKILLIVLILIVAAWAVTMTILSATSRRPDNLGVHEGKLAPCPNTPNCVSSQTDDEAHRMAPIPFEGRAGVALDRLEATLAARPRTAGVKKMNKLCLYLRAECTSFLFRFVDDVEFLVDPEAKVIHFRSASRVGRSDFGVNRKRMEEIRKDFESLSVARP
jgi:uncharacterized protein (DUF1499 family)